MILTEGPRNSSRERHGHQEILFVLTLLVLIVMVRSLVPTIG